MPEFKTAQICDTTNQTDIFPEVQMLNLNSTITNETHRKGQFFINVFGLLGCLDLWDGRWDPTLETCLHSLR